MPAPTTFFVSAAIEPGHGQYGTQTTIRVPAITSGQGSVASPFGILALRADYNRMLVLTALRLGLVIAMSCAVLAGCASDNQERPLPELSATRAGNVVTVRYHLTENALPRPKWIVVKVRNATASHHGPGGIPSGGNYRVHGNNGQVKIDIPFEGHQLVAMARTIDLKGHSEIAETPVR